MRFYQLSRFLFPRSFRLRMFALCFAGTHIPLISFIVWQLSGGRFEWQPVLILLAATVVGSVVAIAGVGGLLAPVVEATQALSRVERRETVTELAPGGPDLVGHLIRAVNNAARATDMLITRLDQAASQDPLTGLDNRRGFVDRVQSALLRHASSTIALIDIDHFKQVNDRLGHVEGDRILTAFAAALRHGLRESDIIARWGGEEFAILFPGTAPAIARASLERVRMRLAITPIASIDSRHLSFSAGMTRIVEGVSALEPSLARADRALYQAKNAGRDRILIAGDGGNAGDGGEAQ